MQVWFLIDSLGSGGAERSTVALAPRLREFGVEPTVITLYRARDGFEDELLAAGVPLLCLSSTRFWPRMRELRLLLRRDRPDVLHTALYSSDQLGRLAALATAIPVVSSLVNTPRPLQLGAESAVRIAKNAAARAIDWLTGAIGVSRYHAVTVGVADAYRRAYRVSARRVSVVERGREAATLPLSTGRSRSTARAQLGIDEDATVVLSIGRHDRQKGHLDLLAAFDQAVGRLRSPVLLIAGRDGEMTTEIERAVAERELGSQATMLGFRDDIPDLLAAADVLVISSMFEGTAGVAIEAMAIGCPIATTDVEGLRGTLVHRQHALVTPLQDPTALADAIVEICTDGQLSGRLRTNGRELFEERFTIERSAHDMAALYHSLVLDPSSTSADGPRR